MTVTSLLHAPLSMSEVSDHLELELAPGLVLLFDPIDEELVRSRAWSARRNGGTVYVRAARQPKKLLHRLIMHAPAGIEVDHRNGDGLDNRRSNLRLATHAQNMANRRPNERSTSRFKGVGWYRPGVWRARIRIDGDQRLLGYFDTEESAARAYDAAAIQQWGDFARLNFPT